MPEPLISAVIIARDEAIDLAGCLDSLRWVDEVVVVVDDRTQDATEPIALSRGARVTRRRFDSFANQRNAGIELARGRWILSIDADERVTAALAAELRALAQAGSQFTAARMPISSEILGRTLRFSGTQLDRPIRFFLRDGNRWQGDVHERIQPSGPTTTLEHPLMHRSLANLDEFLTKLHAYTTLEARNQFAKGVRPRRGDLWLRPAWFFLKIYLVRQGFRDGVEGFVYCVLSAVSAFVRNAKLRELWTTGPDLAQATRAGNRAQGRLAARPGAAS